MKIGAEFPGFLTLLFVAFKILGHITWSWWWVFSPLWIPFIIFAAVFATIAIIKVAFD